jgi:hypothetical protein
MSDKYASELMRGSFVAVQPANPAPGANFQWVVPNFGYIEIQSIAFRLVTDANVASRNARIVINDDAVNDLYSNTPAVAQAASLTRTYYASQASLVPASAYPNALQLALPPRYILGPGCTVNITVDSIQATDQIALVNICYLRHALPS